MSTAVTLAHGLALAGQHTLLVDLDPQGHVAFALGMDKAPGLYRLVVDEEKISDVLLLLEHPPIITVGKSGTLDNVLIARERLVQQGISLFFIDRGGDVTYHGPGQLVGYPMIDLGQRGKDLHRYVNDLEEVILRTLKDFSIDGQRDKNHPGVWVNEEEIAAIGLSLRRWVSMHGFALNINTDLEHFSYINPCGFSDRRATSMSKILNGIVSMKEVANSLILHFCDVFGFQERRKS